MLTTTNNNVRDRLTKARVKMLLKHPFWGNLATRLKLTEASDWCSTAATDGRHFFYNTEFIQKLDDDELVFLFGHEVGHCVYSHMLRRGERNPQLWNMAGDYVINDMLVENRVGKRITTVPILLDPKFKDMTTEEIYDKLKENSAEIKVTLDMHIDLTDPKSDGDQDGNKKSNSGKPNAPDFELDEEAAKQLQDEIREAILQAASAAAGNVPVGIKRMISQLTAPKMSWQNLLRIQLESSLKNNYSFTRPSRKSWHTGAVLPGMLPAENLDVAIAIDASGSISEAMIRDFLSEVHGMMELYSNYSIHVFTFDTRVYNPQTYTEDNGADIADYEAMGGGGTDFEVCWDYMKDNQIEPKQFIMFTDGYPGSTWGDENYCDTLFVIHGNDSIEAPFGVTAHYSRD